MSVLEILRWPDPRLSMACAPVGQVTEDIRVLASDMFDTMYAAPGRGLAAPQVGVLKRMFVMDATWKDDVRTPEVFIDPQIISADVELSEMEEGCLSIPGIMTSIARPTWVEVRWQDLNGEACEQRFTGFSAACVQHEIDHLDGVVTLDRLDADTRASVLEAYEGVPV
ncbi:MAG: peptide deformylase [Roseobacter sp.]|jgi:peptide deformylase